MIFVEFGAIDESGDIAHRKVAGDSEYSIGKNRWELTVVRLQIFIITSLLPLSDRPCKRQMNCIKG